jgi:dCMP deaminase
MMRKRISKIENFMRIAETICERSHDEETQVGAILVKNESGAIIATGYNGFVRGAPDDELPCTRPDKYEYMMHAEQNLIFNCARYGVGTHDTTLICTHSPCKLCMRMLFSCGITQVIVKNLYRDWQEILLMRDISVDYKFCKKTGYYYLTYLVEQIHAPDNRKNSKSKSRKDKQDNSRTRRNSKRKSKIKAPNKRSPRGDITIT